MTEDEWLNGWEPEPALRFLNGNVSDRKLRLFGVACCRAAEDELTQSDPAMPLWLSVIERYADGLATESELEVARDESFDRVTKYDSESASPEQDMTMALFLAVNNLAEAHPNVVGQVANALVHLESEIITYKFDVRPLLHEVFGNPFRPVAVDLVWLTSTVSQLARGIYEDRAFDRMPILADALQDAGCDNSDILTHCRDESAAHVRGCWVVDLLLGKT